MGSKTSLEGEGMGSSLRINISHKLLSFFGERKFK